MACVSGEFGKPVGGGDGASSHGDDLSLAEDSSELGGDPSATSFDSHASDDDGHESTPSSAHDDSTATPSTGDPSQTDTSQADTSSTPDESTLTSDSSDTTSTSDPICGVMECAPGDPNACGPAAKCTPYRCEANGCCTDSTRCTKITGDAKVGETCTRDGEAGQDNCAPGLFCKPNGKNSGESGEGTCLDLCDPKLGEKACVDHDAPRPSDWSMHCFALNRGTLPLCADVCDPLRDECSAGQTCFLMGDGFSCLDRSSNPSAADEPCTDEAACAPGFSCIDRIWLSQCSAACTGAAFCGCCTQLCDLTRDDDSSCSGAGACQPLPFDPIGNPKTGICQ